MTVIAIRQMSDERLLDEVRRVAATERRSTADLLALLIEVERRGLQLAMGYSSLFTYCRQALHLSEQAAYSRITAARAARRLPVLLELLADGALTLSSIGLLAPHLTEENHESLIAAARYTSTRDVERLIASLHPAPDIASSLRRVPVARQPADTVVAARLAVPVTAVAAGVSAAVTMDSAVATANPAAVAASPTTVATAEPADGEVVSSPRPPPTLLSSPCPPIPSSTPQPPAPSRAVLAPLAPRRYFLKVTISQETHDKLQRARDLLRHVVPDGDPAAILDRALTVLVEQAARTKYGEKTRLRPFAAGSRSETLTLALTQEGARDQTPARTSDRTPAGTPAGTHDRTHDRTQDRTRDRMPDRQHIRAPNRTRGETHDRTRARPPDRGRPAGPRRYIPAEVKRVVWTRDAGRCAFVGAAGRCREMGFLEFHHVVPFAVGGRTDPANLQLRCRAHNAHEATIFFGPDRAHGPPSREV